MRDVQSLTDWVWRINSTGSLAEAVAATSFAVEGAAGALARKVAAGFEAYREVNGVDMNPKTYKWIREHAHYDDEHPKFKKTSAAFPGRILIGPGAQPPHRLTSRDSRLVREESGWP